MNWQDNLDNLCCGLQELSSDRKNCVGIPVPMFGSFNLPLAALQNGADPNRLESSEITPLHHAVYFNNLKAVCMLLYYGADVNIVNSASETPLMVALEHNRSKISQALIDFYDDFSRMNLHGSPALLYATQHKRPLAIDLVKRGADVNCVDDSGRFPLGDSLKYANAELFKLIWPSIDFQILLNNGKPFLLTYLVECNYSSLEWVECLYLLLKSPIAFDLVQECKCETYSRFWYVLLGKFYKNNVEMKDRVAIIYICLSLGAKIEIATVGIIYSFYGFNQELEACIYAGNLDYFSSVTVYPPLSFILALEDRFQPEEILKLEHFASYNPISISSLICKESVGVFDFFSIPCYIKKALIDASFFWSKAGGCYVSAKAAVASEFPTLFELSRNEACQFVKQNFKIRRSYEFHDAVKSLNLPERLKDCIRFKAPIY